MAPALKAAVLAIEDSRFFAHKGVDLRALARALRRNAEAGEVKEGGSTITQQYVKNVLLDPKKTVSRKVREAIMALQLERTHTKEAILEGYLNRIYFGNGAYGVQAAAQLYFAKPASALTLAEGAAAGRPDPGAGELRPLRHPGRRLRPPPGRARPACGSCARRPSPTSPPPRPPRSASWPSRPTPATRPATSWNGSSGSSSTTSASAPPRPTAAGSCSRRGCASARPSTCASSRRPRTR